MLGIEKSIKKKVKKQHEMFNVKNIVKAMGFNYFFFKVSCLVLLFEAPTPQQFRHIGISKHFPPYKSKGTFLLWRQT